MRENLIPTNQTRRMLFMVNPLIAFGIQNWMWDIIALIITFVLILVLIRINDVLRKRELVPIYVSRKVIHTFAGPLFLVCWLLFSGDGWSRYFASVVAWLFVFLFLALGLQIMKNEEFVRTMSRSGEPREFLRGTLFYALVMAICAIMMWYVPANIDGTPNFAIFVPTAFLIFGPLAGGDGFADIIGRKWGKHKVLGEKSIEGSIAMFLFSILFTYGLLGIYWLLINPVQPAAISLIKPLIPILVIALVATIVEILSPKTFDNLLIPIATVIVIYLLWFFALYPYPLWHIFPGF
jgi:phytol kinase